eukprot:6745475-Prymnesium_polylepis.2
MARSATVLATAAPTCSGTSKCPACPADRQSRSRAAMHSDQRQGPSNCLRVVHIGLRPSLARTGAAESSPQAQ